jgi:large subunit ribosomal protein L21
MYAVFEDGSRQYRVEQGSTVVIDHRDGVNVGDTLDLNKVLLIADGATAKIGQPLVAGAKVTAKVVGLPTKKTITQKFRRRKNSKRLKGHTQPYLRVTVQSIAG